jgi:aminopeptidase N
MRNLLRDEAEARAALIQVASYEIDLDLTAEEDFGSTVVIRFACRQPGTSTFVELDGTPLEVTLNGRDLGTGIDDNRIVLPDLQADNELRVVARCSWSRTGEGLHRFTDPADGLVYVWGQSFLDDAQRSFACFDQPDLKATFDVSVTAPQEWIVIGNERGTNNDGRWTFRQTQRMPTSRRRSCSRSPRSASTACTRPSGSAIRSATPTTSSGCRSSTTARWRTPAQ